MRITVESPVIETPRVLQVRGLFDLPARNRGPATPVREAAE